MWRDIKTYHFFDHASENKRIEWDKDLNKKVVSNEIYIEMDSFQGLRKSQKSSRKQSMRILKREKLLRKWRGNILSYMLMQPLRAM